MPLYLAPAVKGLLGHAVLAGQLGDRDAPLVGLDSTDDLLFGMAITLHLIARSPAIRVNVAEISHCRWTGFWGEGHCVSSLYGC